MGGGKKEEGQYVVLKYSRPYICLLLKLDIEKFISRGKDIKQYFLNKKILIRIFSGLERLSLLRELPRYSVSTPH